MENLVFFLKLFKWGLLSGLFFAVSSALTSPYLILQKNSLFPHAITHLLLLSLLILSVISPLVPHYLHFPFLLLLTLLLSSFIHLLVKVLHIFEDTATSLITYLSLGVALIFATKTSQYDITLLNYLFGSLFTVEAINVSESLFVFIISLGLFFYYKDIWLTLGIEKEVPGLDFQKAQFFFLLLITLQTLIGVKLMGVLLVSAFFVFASTLALKSSPSFKWVVPLTIFFNLFAVVSGFLLSIYFDLPFSAGAIIIMGLYIPMLFLVRHR